MYGNSIGAFFQMYYVVLLTKVAVFQLMVLLSSIQLTAHLFSVDLIT